MGGRFCFVWPQWRKFVNVWPCTNKVVIYGKGKNFQKQFESNIFKCNALMLSILSFYLHYFTFLTVTFEIYNNIDSKTKKLFILNGKF